MWATLSVKVSARATISVVVHDNDTADPDDLRQVAHLLWLVSSVAAEAKRTFTPPTGPPVPTPTAGPALRAVPDAPELAPDPTRDPSDKPRKPGW